MIDMTPIIIDKTPDTRFTGGLGGMARRYADGERIGWHRHAHGQLIFAISGLMRVETATGLWLAPPERAAWMPVGAPHSISMQGDVEMRTVYVEAACMAVAADERLALPRVIGVSPLLRALVLQAFDPTFARRAGAIAALLLDEIAEARATATFLPMPTSPALRSVADLAIADRTWADDLYNVAAQAGLSERTASRLFPKETGMTFKRWRQHARVMAAVERLNRGERPKAVARALGFSSPAAFAASFRSVVGRTPGTFTVVER